MKLARRDHLDAAYWRDHRRRAGPERRSSTRSLRPMPAANSCRSRRSRFLSLLFDRFTFLAKSATPGKYAYTSGLDVLTAVATAGGFTYRASKTDGSDPPSRRGRLAEIFLGGSDCRSTRRSHPSTRKVLLDDHSGLSRAALHSKFELSYVTLNIRCSVRNQIE